MKSSTHDHPDVSQSLFGFHQNSPPYTEPNLVWRDDARMWGGEEF